LGSDNSFKSVNVSPVPVPGVGLLVGAELVHGHQSVEQVAFMLPNQICPVRRGNAAPMK